MARPCSARIRAQSITAPCPTPTLATASWTVRKILLSRFGNCYRRRLTDWFLGPFSCLTIRRPMPSNDGLRLDNRDRVKHRRKKAIEPDKQQSVRHRQLRLRGYALAQHVQLMPKHDDLGFQPRLRPERRDHNMKKQAQKRSSRISLLISHVTPARMEYSVRTGRSSCSLAQRRV